MCFLSTAGAHPGTTKGEWSKHRAAGQPAGSLWDVIRDTRLNHQPEVIGGVLAQECGALLREFFSARRRHQE